MGPDRGSNSLYHSPQDFDGGAPQFSLGVFYHVMRGQR
jgi:hypothetical protein